MNPKLRGTICGVAAAVFYGTNPLGAMNLYADGITANSTLFYRFGLAALMLAVMMLVQRKSFALTRRELITLVALGILMGSSSSSLYISFNHMDVGIASTLLFVYPVMVAIIMAALFKEKVTAATVFAIVLSLGGIALLNHTEGGASLSTLGVTLVMISSLTYAVYIVVVNKSSLRMSSVKLTFYTLVFGLCTILCYTFAMGETVQLIDTPRQWFYSDCHHGCAGAYDGSSHRCSVLWRALHVAPCIGHHPYPYRCIAHHLWQGSVATQGDNGARKTRAQTDKDMAMEVVKWKLRVESYDMFCS